MADPKVTGIPLSDTAFQPVTTAPIMGGGVTRTPGSCVLQTSGRVVLNAEATQAYAEIAEASNIPKDQRVSFFGIDTAHGLVSVSVVRMGTLGSVPVRRNGSNVILHLGGVFAEHPLLRTTQRSKCMVSTGTDAGGKPILIIGLSTAVPMHHIPRSSSSGKSAESSGTAAASSTGTKAQASSVPATSPAAPATAPANTPTSAPAASTPANADATKGPDKA